MTDLSLRPVPYHPLTILTPPLHTQPNDEALKLIRAAVGRIVGDDTVYSVTFSPLVCPADKRSLYVFLPFFWQRENGKWDHRDGQHNPVSFFPQGQHQLQQLCEAIRDLALGVKYITDPAIQRAANDKAKQLLKVFFMDEETKMLPEVEHAQINPGQVGAKGNHFFVIPIRALVLVTQHLPLLELGPELERDLKAWFRAHIEFMQNSPQGKQCAVSEEDKPFWYNAILATHLNYLDPPRGEIIARQELEKTAGAFPAPDQFFMSLWDKADRRHLCLFILEPMFLMAQLSRPSKATLDYLEGLATFAKTVPNGTVDVHSDTDERYRAKLALFERILAVMRGGQPDTSVEMGGTAWEGGWSEFMTISWKLLG